MDRIPMLRWLHISDLHFKKDEPTDRRFILRSLLECIQKEAKREGFDVIFVTGDLAFSGQKEEYFLVTEFFDKLLKCAEIGKERLFVVPGNHDLDRARVHWLKRELESQDEIDDYFKPGSGSPHIKDGLAGFLEWHDGYFPDRTPFPTDSTCQTLGLVELAKTSINVLILNSAAFARDDHDHGKLIIGRSCLDDAIQQLAGSKHPVFALTHHPADWLSEVDRPFIRSTLRSAVDILLSGHTHDPDAITATTHQGQLVVVAAGATYQTEKYPNSFWIGSWDGERVCLSPFRYTKDPKPVWSLDTSINPDHDKYCLTFPMEDKMGTTSEPTANELSTSADTSASFVTDDLLVSPRGEALYVEPTLHSKAYNDVTRIEEPATNVTINEIIASDSSYLIESRSEYGATTLSKRLHSGINASGRVAVCVNARQIPGHGAKLLAAVHTDSENATLVIDDFDIADHEKLLTTIQSANLFYRYILVSVPSAKFQRSSSISLPSLDSFKTLFHWPLSRGDIRQLAEKMFGITSSDNQNAVVEKVYNDLISLRIPLTPGNTVMYLRVLLREENFAPLNRVDIVYRYIAELLRRSSDVYVDAFSAKQKIDVLAAFSFSLFERQGIEFTETDWNIFSRAYSKRTLFDFDSSDLLNELERVRIVYRDGHSYVFRYGFYYPLLIGKYISSRANRVAQFVKNGDSSRLEGLVEVVSGLATDNTDLIVCLVEQLEVHLNEFREDYVSRALDPYQDLKWISKPEDEGRVWKQVEEKLLEGPAGGSEIDKRKTQLLGEMRTDDQSPVYKKMERVEAHIFRVASELTIALKNSESVEGILKIRATKTLFDVDLVALQVGFFLAERINESYIVQWGGIVFVNSEPEKGKRTDESLSRILISLPNAVLSRSGAEVGSRRLSAVFNRLVDELDPKSFAYLSNFHALVQSKGQGWEVSARKAIVSVDKSAFYLSSMLSVLMANFALEVNQRVDRERLKVLISTIQAKRTGHTNRPGSKLIGKVKAALEKANRFDIIEPSETPPKTG